MAPNTRVDFHDDPVEEWFFQQKGDMMLKIADGGKIYDVPVREGEVFMLPRMYDMRLSAHRKDLWGLS